MQRRWFTRTGKKMHPLCLHNTNFIILLRDGRHTFQTWFSAGTTSSKSASHQTIENFVEIYTKIWKFKKLMSDYIKQTAHSSTVL